MVKLTRYNPYWHAASLFRMADQLLAQRAGAVPDAYLPPMDIEETSELYVVSLSAPGYQQEQLSISVEDDQLHIRGSQTEDNENDEANQNRKFHLRERRMQRFARTLRLPQGVATDNIQAQYEAGVLTLTIPKPAEAQPKQIEIKVN